MITLFASGNGLLADHWIVLVSGLAFLLFQLSVCIRFCLVTRRDERLLLVLSRDIEQGGDGRDLSDAARRFPWLVWVETNFPRGTTTPGNFTRDDVLKELDTRVGSDGNYLMLQRAGVMAPLLGVILTVFGFAVLKLDDMNSESLGQILSTITPLVAGVGTGALLGFINQFLLHFAGARVEHLRMAARTWFDVAIWSGVGLDTQAATVKAVAAIEKMTHSITASAEHYHVTTSHIYSAVQSMDGASTAFNMSVQAFRGEMEGLPATLLGLKSAAEAAVETLHSMVTNGQRVVVGLDVSVAAFRSAVDTQFVEAAKQHRTAVGSLEESLGRISESTQHLKLGTSDLQETVNSHANSFKTLNRTLQRDVLPAHEAFHAVISQFAGKSEGLLERVDDLNGQLVAALEKITSLAPDAADAVARFAESSNVFSDAVQNQFATAAAEHLVVIESLEAAVGGIDQSAKALQQSSSALAEQVLSQGAASKSLQESVSGDVLPAHRQLHTASTSFDGTARRLADQVAGFQQLLEAFRGHVDAVAPDLRQAVAGVVPAVNTFRQAIDEQFVSATDQQRKSLVALAASVEQFQRTARALSDGAVTMESLLQNQHRLSQDSEPAQAALRQATSDLAALGRSLHVTFDSDVAPAQRALHSAAETFTLSAQKLATFIHTGLEPATHRLANLDQTLASLDGTLAALRDFANVRQDIERLSQSLSQAAQVAEAIGALPEQIRQVLEQTAANNHFESARDSRGWFPYLFGGNRSDRGTRSLS